MKILLHHQRNIDGKVLAKGQHALPDQMQDHWYIQALVKSGDAVIVEHAKHSKLPVSQEKPAESKSEKGSASPDSDDDSAELDMDDLDDSDLLDDESVDGSDEEDTSDSSASEKKPSKKSKKTARNHKGR